MNGLVDTLRPHVGANPWQIGGDALLLRFRELHDKNLSFGEIAAKLNSEFPIQLTRNSCIGKATRLGFPVRAITPSERGKITHQRRRARSEVKRLQTPAGETMRNTGNGFKMVALVSLRLREADAVPRHLTLMEIERDQCRYPYGDDAPFTFCGCAVVPSKPYCAPHYDLTRVQA